MIRGEGYCRSRMRLLSMAFGLDIMNELHLSPDSIPFGMNEDITVTV